VCFIFLYNFCSEHFSLRYKFGKFRSRRAQKGVQVKKNCPLLLSDLNKILVNLSNIKFHENPLSCSRVQTAGMAKLTSVIVQLFVANVPKIAGIKRVDLNEI
jgi:hypothetical protein